MFNFNLGLPRIIFFGEDITCEGNKVGTSDCIGRLIRETSSVRFSTGVLFNLVVNAAGCEWRRDIYCRGCQKDSDDVASFHPPAAAAGRRSTSDGENEMKMESS